MKLKNDVCEVRISLLDENDCPNTIIIDSNNRSNNNPNLCHKEINHHPNDDHDHLHPHHHDNYHHDYHHDNRPPSSQPDSVESDTLTARYSTSGEDCENLNDLDHKIESNHHHHHHRVETNPKSSSAIELIWRDLSYEAQRDLQWNPFAAPVERKTNDRKRYLIHNLSGSIRSGQLTAIIGPSGAGKTTLIECLAGRRVAGITGDIVVNCDGVSSDSIKISYYSQRDSLNELLTVEESLLYASRLHNCLKSIREKDEFFDMNSNMGDDDDDDDDSVDHQDQKIEMLKMIEVDEMPDEQTEKTTTQKTNNKITNLRSNETLDSIRSRHYHQLVVNRLVADLHLEKCRNTTVSRCSGGQKRRLSIALELIFAPSILLLDEPTSGLDSRSSLQCISMLKKLVSRDCRDNPRRKPMIVATSIHQPTAKMMSYFDRLYIVSHDGRCIYNGTANSAVVVDTLAAFGMHCPRYHNPADFVIEIASGDYGDSCIAALASHYRQITEYQHRQQQQQQQQMKISQNLLPQNEECDDKEDEDEDEDSRSTITIRKLIRRAGERHRFNAQISHALTLTRRTLCSTFRDPNIYLARFATVMVTLGLLMILYRDQRVGELDGCVRRPSRDHRLFQAHDHVGTFAQLLDEPHRYYANFGFLFFAVVLIVFISILPTLLSFPLEASVLVKENYNGWYSLKAYYAARQIADIPPVTLFPLLFGIPAYLITGQPFDWTRFCLFQLALILLSFVAQSAGLLVAAYFANDVTSSAVVGATSNIPLFLFTGLLIRIATIPEYFRPFTYLSYFRLAFESLLVIVYGLGRCDPIEPIDFAYLKNEFGDHIIDAYVCVADFVPTAAENITAIIDDYNREFVHGAGEYSWSYALKGFEYRDSTLWFNFAGMIAYIVVIRVAAYWVLYCKTKPK